MLIKKILIEALGVPPITPIINTVITDLKKRLHGTTIKPYTQTYTFPFNKTFPLTKLNLELELMQESEAANKVFCNGATDSSLFKKFEDGSFAATITLRLSIPATNSFLFIISGGTPPTEKEILLNLESTLTHELTHVYEELKRKEHLALGLLGSRDSMTSVAGHQIYVGSKKFLPPSLSEFLFFLYAAASFEVSARVAQTYPFLKGVKGNAKRMEVLKNTEAWKTASALSDFTYNKFYSEFTHEIAATCREDGIKPEDFFNDVITELEKALTTFSEDHLTAAMKSVDTEPSPMIVANTKKVIRGATIHTANLLHKSPTGFFKYWVKAFNHAGEKSKKKLLKLVHADF